MKLKLIVLVVSISMLMLLVTASTNDQIIYIKKPMNLTVNNNNYITNGTSSGSGFSYWNRTGTTLFPNTTTDTVNITGDLNFINDGRGIFKNNTCIVIGNISRGLELCGLS